MSCNIIKNGSRALAFTGNVIFIVLLIFSTNIHSKQGILTGKYMSSDSLNNKLVQINSAEYIWSIDNTNSWNDLHTFLPSAKMAGTAIWIKLLPPSKVPQYSEPYKNDYIRWAEEIAKLSLRYSNLKGYSIQELQQNIDQGYFTQSYIDNMKTKGISINPKLKFIITDKTYKLYYVDKDAKGNGDGTSWTNAATSVSALNWNAILGGDTIYISGGTGSKTYYSSLRPKNSGTPDQKIIITRGKDEGHNGLPIFDCRGIWTGSEYPLLVSESYLEVSYLSFRNGVYQTILIDQQTDVDIFHCEVIHPFRHGITVNKSFNTRIMYNTITTGTTDENHETDAIVLAAENNIGGNCEIAYNTIIETNLNSNDHHQDAIQTYPTWGSTGVTKIHHNFIMQNPSSNAPHTGGIYVTGSQGFYEIYDNIIISKGGYDANLIGLNKGAGMKMYAKVFNNTLIASNPSVQVFSVSNLDSLEYKNNIIYKPNGSSAVRLMGTTINGYVNINYNHYYISDTSSSYGSGFAVVYNGKSDYIGWSEWKKSGYDINGTVGKITFANLWGTKIADYRMIDSAYCKDAGTPIKLFRTDIQNILRPQGSAWDIGALEQ